MEGYLHNLRSLRSQMNDIEEEAAKRSAEEQKHKTAIQTIEDDLKHVRSESTRLNQEAEAMEKAKADLCCQIVDNHRKISALENESLTLSQTLELLQQEMTSTAVKLKEKRSYYGKIMAEMNLKLRDQQDCFSTYQYKMTADGQPVEELSLKQMHFTEGNHDEVPSKEKGDTANEEYNSVVSQLESAKTKVEELTEKKFQMVLERNKPALKAMDIKALEEEHKALLADKCGELEYLKSLREQINQLRGMSQVIKCQCGEEYKVDMML